VRVVLSGNQVGMLRFFAGAQDVPRFWWGSCGVLVEVGLIERDERQRYRLTELGWDIATRLDRLLGER
jgi:hypothetical protein